MTYNETVERIAKIARDPLAIREITKKEYWDALECLPPLRWGANTPGVESFFLSEFTCGTFTENFATTVINGDIRYFKRESDYTDRTTWLSREMIHNWIKYMEAPQVEAYFKTQPPEALVYYRLVKLTNHSVIQFRDASGNWLNSLSRYTTDREPFKNLLPCEAPND